MAKKKRREKDIQPEETAFYVSLLKKTTSLYKIENGKLRDNFSELEIYYKQVLEITLRITAVLNALKHSRIFVQSIHSKRVNRKIEPTDAQFLRYHLECYAIRVTSFKDVFLKLINRTYRLDIKENVGLERNILSHAEMRNIEIITGLMQGLNVLMKQLEPQRHRIAHGNYHEDLNLILLESIETRFDNKIKMPKAEMQEYKEARERLIAKNSANMILLEFILQKFMVISFSMLHPVRKVVEKELSKN